MQGEPADYPASRYLIGRGQGPSPELAQDRARAELAKTFSVRIQAVSRDLAEYFRRGEAVALKQVVTRRIRSHTEQVLEGVEIADLWRDPDSGTFYALAVLERQRAAARLRARLADLDEVSEGALRGGDPLDRVRGLYVAYRAQLTRAGLAAALGVLTNRPPPAPPFTLGRLQRRLGEALGALAVAPEGDPPELAAAAGDALAALGVQVAQGAAPYRLQVALELTPVGVHAGWHWLRGTVQMTLEDGKGRPRAHERRPLKAAALDEAQAQARLLTEAGRQVRDAVPRLVLGEGRPPGSSPR